MGAGQTDKPSTAIGFATNLPFFTACSMAIAGCDATFAITVLQSSKATIPTANNRMIA
jgi:hypothetical protein